MKYILFVLTLMTTFYDVQGQLSFPVLNALLRMDSSGARKDIYFYPREDYHVKAAESGLVRNIFNVDSNYTVVILGKCKIYYANLHKVFVKDGQNVEAGELIGELVIAKDIPQAEALIIRVVKRRKCVFDSTLFKRQFSLQRPAIKLAEVSSKPHSPLNLLNTPTVNLK